MGQLVLSRIIEHFGSCAVMADETELHGDRNTLILSKSLLDCLHLRCRAMEDRLRNEINLVSTVKLLSPSDVNIDRPSTWALKATCC